MNRTTEPDAANPANQTDPQWAAQFSRLLMSWAQAQPNGKAQVQERNLDIDPSRMATPQKIEAADAAVNRDFLFKPDGSLWHVESAHPQYGSFSAGGEFNFSIRFCVTKFVWEDIPGTRERRRKVSEEKYVDADEFFAAHKLIETHEDKSWREFCETQNA